MRRLLPLLLFCLTLLHAAPPAWAGADPITSLRIGLLEYYPPFSFTDEGGRRAGFDQDVAEALCAIIDIPCEYTYQQLPELLQSMRQKSLDVLVASLVSSPERRQYMAFTAPYYRTRSVYIGKPGSASINPSGLAGKKLGVLEKSVQADYAQKTWGKVAQIVLAPHRALEQMLIRGEIDVLLLNSLPAYDFLKTSAGAEMEVLAEVGPDELMTEASIALRRDEPILLEMLNDALVRMRLNGDFNRINRKYFPFSIH